MFSVLYKSDYDQQLASLIIVKDSPSTVGKNSLIISTLKMLLSTEDLRYSLKLISCLSPYTLSVLSKKKRIMC